MLSELHDLDGDLERTDTPEGVRIQVRLPAVVAERFDRYAVNGDRPLVAGVAPCAPTRDAPWA